MTKRILVTGATGNIGSQLIPRLAAHEGIEVRALVRNADKAQSLQDVVDDLAVCSFEDELAVRAACTAVDTVVLITAPNPDAADQASIVIEAAKHAGVRKIVRISALGADVNGPTDNTRQHGRTDAEVQASGLTYVILRPHFFMQNLFMSVQSIAADGTMYWGMGDGKLGMIDVRDIIDSAEQAVISDAFDNRVLNPTGPASVSLYDVADAFSQALGRPVTYIPVSLDMVEQSLLGMGMGDWYPRVMRDYSKAYSEGWGDYTTPDVEQMTGHPARSIQTFAQEILAPAMGGMG